MVDYKLLEKTINSSGIKRGKLAENLDITRTSLWLKCTGKDVGGRKREFTASELERLKESLSLTNTQFRRIFFATERECKATLGGESHD